MAIQQQQQQQQQQQHQKEMQPCDEVGKFSQYFVFIA